MVHSPESGVNNENVGKAVSEGQRAERGQVRATLSYGIRCRHRVRRWRTVVTGRIPVKGRGQAAASEGEGLLLAGVKSISVAVPGSLVTVTG